MGSEYAVPVEEAIERLEVDPDYDPGDGPKPCVHTFVIAGFGPIGAHWSLEDVRALWEEHGVEEAGPNMAAMGHGLATVRPDRGPVFFATKAEFS